MPKYSLNTLIVEDLVITVIFICTIALLCYPYLINVLRYVTNFWALAYTGCKAYLPRRSAEQMKYSQAEGYKEFMLYWQWVPDAVFGNPVSFLSLATPWKLFWTRIAVGNSKHYQKFFANLQSWWTCCSGCCQWHKYDCTSCGLCLPSAGSWAAARISFHMREPAPEAISIRLSCHGPVVDPYLRDVVWGTGE